ncbi:hypothetical protein ACPESR_15635 [Nocardia testacea]|uniref:hypothetical protein n=1 Tax=Nocardia testacea TaxID=248551 RepID=UPI003C2D0ED0
MFRPISGLLVLGCHTAVRILHDTEHFTAGPRTWQATGPPDSPVLPMMRWHPAARYSTGPDHQRYPQASKDRTDAVDGHAMHTVVEELEAPLINGFCETGSAELVGDYARPLTVVVLKRIALAAADTDPAAGSASPSEVPRFKATGRA